MYLVGAEVIWLGGVDVRARTLTAVGASERQDMHMRALGSRVSPASLSPHRPRAPHARAHAHARAAYRTACDARSHADGHMPRREADCRLAGTKRVVCTLRLVKLYWKMIHRTRHNGHT